MEHIWLKQYPQGIPAEVDVEAYASLKDIFEQSCARFADLPAYSNMDHAITYRELDAASRAVGAYLQKVCGLNTEPLPKTNIGKILRRELRAPATA